MKAAVCNAFGKPLSIEEVEIAPPRSGEVKVRVAATAICHSDVNLIRGRWGGALPVIAGHESAGVVEEVGEGVTRVHPGDRVVLSLLRSCGRCYYCLHQLPHMCSRAPGATAAPRLRNRRGQTVAAGMGTAAFAERAVVHESQVIPIPHDITMDRAALLACGVITGFGAVANTAKVEAGESVAVIGAGGIGLNVIQAAAAAGAQPIIAADVLDVKLATARLFGATHTIHSKRQDVVCAIRDLTEGRGVDFAFVAAGTSGVVEQALGAVRLAGAVVIVGLPEEGVRASFTILDFVSSERRILASFMGSSRLDEDVPRLLGLYRRRRLKLDELITGRYPLERINEAIEEAETGAGLRNVIVFDDAA